MAEEVVRSWENINQLVIELSAPDQVSDIRKVRERINQVLKNPTVGGGQTMRFRLVDADGKSLAFPLTLISDTTLGSLGP